MLKLLNRPKVKDGLIAFGRLYTKILPVTGSLARHNYIIYSFSNDQFSF